MNIKLNFLYLNLQTQEREAKNKMREKAKELQRQKLEAVKKGGKNPMYSSGTGFGSNAGYNPMPSIGDTVSVMSPGMCSMLISVKILILSLNIFFFHHLILFNRSKTKLHINEQTNFKQSYEAWKQIKRRRKFCRSTEKRRGDSPVSSIQKNSRYNWKIASSFNEKY